MIDWDRKTINLCIHSKEFSSSILFMKASSGRRKSCQVWNVFEHIYLNCFPTAFIYLTCAFRCPFHECFVKVENKKQHDAICVVSACFSIFRIMCVKVKIIMAKEIQSYLQNETNKKKGFSFR